MLSWPSEACDLRAVTPQRSEPLLRLNRVRGPAMSLSPADDFRELAFTQKG